MTWHRGLNYPSNCGPYFATAREIRHPLQDNGSATDQSEYRAKLAAAPRAVPETCQPWGCCGAMRNVEHESWCGNAPESYRLHWFERHGQG